jgi:hypothetical protein
VILPNGCLSMMRSRFLWIIDNFYYTVVYS